MNSELAESFFHNIYETHTPDSWGDCSVCGANDDSIDYPCDFYKSAAEILGLPIVEWVRPEPKPRTPEEEKRHQQFMRMYEPMVRMYLEPPLFWDLCKPKATEGETVTFRIQS